MEDNRLNRMVVSMPGMQSALNLFVNANFDLLLLFPGTCTWPHFQRNY
jgi:hypothetical protein